ncbi:MAG: glycerophosphoryl diester phosphodiesterase membrane domain-containing protein [Clostridia bacterium]|nr:glycerophosphoryl diester phosphodiesterase membrane domain-containing protein [Clostridia bacterium]
MEAFRRTVRLVRLNWKTLVLFELFYKAMVAAGFTLLVSFVFRLLMSAMGITYLTRESLGAFLLHPLTLVSILLVTLLAVTCTVTDLCAVVYILDCSAQGFRCRMRQVLRFTLRNVPRVWKPGNLPLAAIVLLLTPFMSLSLIFGLLSTVSLPEFIQESIRQNPHIYGLVLLGVMAIPLLLIRRVYVLHYFALEDCPFRDAWGRSARLSRPLRDYGCLLLAQVTFTALMVLLLLILALIAAGLGRGLNLILHGQWVVGTVIWYSVVLSLGIVFAFSMPVSYGCVSYLFYRHKLEDAEPIVPAYSPAYPLDPVRERLLHTLGFAVLILVAGSLLVVGWLINTGKLNPPIEDFHTLEITAHRGASAQYPENTMAAFRGALELGADWVELDVQQTKDGRIVVLHDPNTRRTTGVAGHVWNMTYEQVSRLDAGSSFSRDFAGEPIPLLSEVAGLARDTGLRLNIELKPTGHETDFEQGVIDIVREYGIADRCVITSQVYSVLQRVKACDPDITTVYVTSLAYGNVDYMSAADHFSVRSSSITPQLVSRVHGQGRQIYAWTVNSRSSINRMIEQNVDNIITDNIETARQCVRESRYSTLLNDLVQTLDKDESQTNTDA